MKGLNILFLVFLSVVRVLELPVTVVGGRTTHVIHYVEPISISLARKDLDRQQALET